jgi:hypothetical protein
MKENTKQLLWFVSWVLFVVFLVIAVMHARANASYVLRAEQLE